MKNRIIFLATILSLAVLGGCASGPSYKEVAGTIKPVAEDQGRIYIYRASSLGAAVQPDVRLNGEVIGSAKPKGFFYVDRPAGAYEISTSTEAERNLTLSLEVGDEKYVRLEVKMGFFVGHIKPVLVDSEEGLKQLQKTKYTGGQK